MALQFMAVSLDFFHHPSLAVQFLSLRHHTANFFDQFSSKFRQVLLSLCTTNQQFSSSTYMLSLHSEYLVDHRLCHQLQHCQYRHPHYPHNAAPVLTKRKRQHCSCHHNENACTFNFKRTACCHCN